MAAPPLLIHDMMGLPPASTVDPSKNYNKQKNCIFCKKRKTFTSPGAGKK